MDYTGHAPLDIDVLEAMWAKLRIIKLFRGASCPWLNLPWWLKYLETAAGCLVAGSSCWSPS